MYCGSLKGKPQTLYQFQWACVQYTGRKALCRDFFLIIIITSLYSWQECRNLSIFCSASAVLSGVVSSSRTWNEVAEGWYVCGTPTSGALLAGPHRCGLNHCKELLEDICKISLCPCFHLNQKADAGVYTRHVNYFDKNITLFLYSKGVTILGQLKKSLERCDGSQSMFIFHENCASGRWIQPQSPTRIWPRLHNKWCTEKKWMKKWISAYIWNLMFKTLLNWGPGWWNDFSIESLASVKHLGT